MPILEGAKEFFDCTVVERVNGYNLIVCKYDANRNGDVECITFIKGIVFCWCFDHHKFHVVVFFEAAAFVDIERVGEEVERNVEG